MNCLFILSLLAIVASIEANDKSAGLDVSGPSLDRVNYEAAAKPPMHPKLVASKALLGDAAGQESKQDYRNLMKENRNEEALGIIDRLLAANKSQKPNLKSEFILRFDRARCLQKLNKTLKALEEAQSVRQLARNAGMPSKPVDKLISSLGLQMDRI